MLFIILDIKSSRINNNLKDTDIENKYLNLMFHLRYSNNFFISEKFYIEKF